MLSRSAKTSWIEISRMVRTAPRRTSRGLRRPRGLKSFVDNVEDEVAAVEVCEDLVD